MAKSPEEEIQEKLRELELSVKEEEMKKPPSVVSNEDSRQLSARARSEAGAVTEPSSDQALNADLCTFSGFGLLALSLVVLFQHIRVSTGWMTLMGGGSSVGLALLPLFIGIAMLFYNYKSRLGQVVTFASVCLLLFIVFSQLVMSLNSVSLLELLYMVIPACAGGALLLKGHYKRLESKEKSE